MFYKQVGEQFIWALAFVDDQLLVASSNNIMEDTMTDLRRLIKIKDLGEVSHYLGMSITRNSDGTFALSQAHTLKATLALAGMENCKPKSAPLEMGTLDNGQDAPLSDEQADLYRSINGRLLYCATSTRPDLLVAVATLAKFMRNPLEKHMSCMKHLLGYIRGTLDVQLTLGGHRDMDRLTIFSDSDWGKDDTRKSRSGSVAFLYGLISWHSQLDHVSLSTAESELYGLCHAAQDALAFSFVLRDLRQTFPKLNDNAPFVVGDNQASLQMAAHNTMSRQLRHVDIRYRFLFEHAYNKTLDIRYTPTDNNLADILTKVLPKGRNAMLRQQLMLSK